MLLANMTLQILNTITPLVPLNKCTKLRRILLKAITLINGEKIYYLNEKNVKTPKDRPIIYANTHKFKPDIEKISLSLPDSIDTL